VCTLKGVKINIADLQEGSILTEDLFVEKRMLMRKGSPLTARIINLLKNRNIKFVYVQSSFVEQKDHVEVNKDMERKEMDYKQEELGQYPDFMKTLAELSMEIRYGHALRNKDDILFVRDLLQKYMEISRYREMLCAMKRQDVYTYLHAIDVFTMCTLFAKKEGIHNIERLAIGFLFHDIGKLKTPIDILQKNGRLSKREFAIMQQHTQDGYDMLCDLNLSQIAHLAKSHHERIDGSGYPEGLVATSLPREVLLLQVIDVYSAITLKRPYKGEIGAAEALVIMYQEKRLFDANLLARFVDFIGIYPENAIVLLSDGSHALVEKVNNQYPLLPTVKKFDSGTSISLPFDFKLRITKMISYCTETPEQLFNKLSEYLISGDSDKMEKYYHKLLEHYSSFEWFTKIYIPIYQIFSVLKNQSVVSETRINEVSVKLRQLLENALFQLRKDNKKSEAILLLVENELKPHAAIQLLEGLLHTEDLYPFILDLDTEENEVLKIADYCKASTICVISKDYNPISCKDRKLNLYHLGEQQLESFVLSFAGEHQQKMDMIKKLEKYKTVTKLLV